DGGAIGREDRVAGSVRRNRQEDMGDAIQRVRGDRLAAMKKRRGKSRLAQSFRLSGGSTGAADGPTFGREPTADSQRSVTQTEAEQMRRGHEGVPAAAVLTQPGRPERRSRI